MIFLVNFIVQKLMVEKPILMAKEECSLLFGHQLYDFLSVYGSLFFFSAFSFITCFSSMYSKAIYTIKPGGLSFIYKQNVNAFFSCLISQLEEQYKLKVVMVNGFLP